MSPIFGIINRVIVDLPRPKKIKGLWKFGSLLGLFLGVQLVSGIFLSFSYVRRIDYAFSSVDLVMRDVVLGSFVRIIHSNGATFFFFFYIFIYFVGFIIIRIDIVKYELLVV